MDDPADAPLGRRDEHRPEPGLAGGEHDGGTLAAGGLDYASHGYPSDVHLYDAAILKERRVIRAHSGFVACETFTKDGKWRYLRQGEGTTVPTPRAGVSTTTTSSTRPSSFGPTAAGAVLGGFIGVASLNSGKSLRLFNGRDHYSDWIFAAGQPRVVGKLTVGPKPPGTGEPGQPGTPGAPTPIPGPTLPGGLPVPQPDLP